MNSRYLLATLVLAAACSGRPSGLAPVARQQKGLDQSGGPGDNEWKIYVVGYENGYVQSPQSTPPADVYNYLKSYRPSFCKNGQHGPACTNNPVVFELIPLNVENPPAPDTAYGPKVVKHFLDGENQLLAFINQSDMNAPSVLASVNAIQTRQQAVFNAANFTQQVRQKKQEAKDYLVDKLNNSAAAVLGPEIAALAATKQNIATIKAFTADYVQASSALGADYKDVAGRYQTYRSNEGTAVDKIAAIAQAAADADLSSIAKLKQQLRDLSANESQLPGQLVIDTARLSSELTSVQMQYDRRLAPLLSFMKDKGFAKPDETSVALHSLAEMYAYCLAREDRIRQALVAVNDGLNRRTQGLLAQATDQATRDTLVKTAQLQSSSAYVGDVNATLGSLWKTLPQSTKLKLYYLSDKADEMTAFLQREGLCSGTVPDYMQTGCKLMKADFTKAHDWLTKTAPSTIRIQLMMMKNAGLPKDRIDAISAELAAGKVRQAAYDQDSLLATSDQVAATDTVPDGGVPYVDESEDD
jgi:hypothetical protein